MLKLEKPLTSITTDVTFGESFVVFDFKVSRDDNLVPTRKRGTKG